MKQENERGGGGEQMHMYVFFFVVVVLFLLQGSYKKLQPFFKDFSRTFQGPH